MSKHLLQITDLTTDDIKQIIKIAFEFKEKAEVLTKPLLKGKVIAMIFEKPSLRTKVAFEVSANSLGACPVFLSSQQILASGQNESGRESIPDIAKNLERYTNLILIRTYSHKTVQEIAANVHIPVINALCEEHHPTQALADLMAIIWHKKSCAGIKVAFIGDGNNVATSLLQICALMGIHFSIASPKGYEIPAKERKMALEYANKSKATINFVYYPDDAVQNADIVYTDTFVSMGQEAEKKKRLNIFKPYQVNLNLLNKAKPNAIFMHCLPAHRGEEVTDEVIDSPQSIILDQAECRLHIAKSLLLFYLS